jgi:hypothetical protein
MIINIYDLLKYRDGYEYRILQVLGRMMNFTFDIAEPKSLQQYG